jgi:pimeloyl-ACP methyl ester carboxylesterase
MLEQKLNLHGVEWKYATGGARGRPAILMFHGAVGGGESMQWLADALADEYRSIAPTVAPVHTLDEVCDAASAILDREHVGRAVVFGGSFGGMIAQAFLKRHPRQVEHLILLSAGAPDPALASKNERALRLMKWLPFALTRALMKAELSRHLKAPKGAEAEIAERVESFRRRLDDYFDHTLTKEVFLSRVRLSIDFSRNETDASTDDADWPGRALIIESDDDPMIGEAARQRLRARYPRAFICAFEGAGHLIPLLRMEELVGVIKAFIKESYAPPDFTEPCPLHEESAAR